MEFSLHLLNYLQNCKNYGEKSVLGVRYMLPFCDDFLMEFSRC